MDSIKSIVVVAILLGVLYGIYQVINDDDSPVSPDSTNLIAEFDSDSDSSKKEKESNDANNNATSEDAKQDSDLDSSADMRVKLDPPPSTFDPNQSQFVYPKKKDEDNTGQPNDLASQNNLASHDRSTGGDGSTGFVPKDSSVNKQFDLLKNRSATNTTGKGDEIYRPETGTHSKSKEVLSSGTTEFNDPRDRFVTGSFAVFEKQVRGDMELAEDMIRKSDFVGALKLLTKFYDDPRLTTEENQNLVSWLDPLAGKVVYSVEHHLLEPYYVRQNDTLNLLSVKFAVPPELIFNINRVAIPDQTKLVPGTELKMVKGPFNAEISLSKNKMTMFVKGMYAGTFKIRIGNEPRPKTGEYRVLSKSRLGQDYSDLNRQRIDALDPRNPYGKYYLNIGGGMALHGSAQVSDSQDTRGCISLNAVDAEDVHNILTTESTITIVD